MVELGGAFRSLLIARSQSQSKVSSSLADSLRGADASIFNFETQETWSLGVCAAGRSPSALLGLEWTRWMDTAFPFPDEKWAKLKTSFQTIASRSWDSLACSKTRVLR